MRYREIFYTVLVSVIFITSCSSPIAKENAENIIELDIGMTINDVKRIMGEPERIVIQPHNVNEYEFQYLSPSGYSDQYRISISRKDSVILRIGYAL